MGMMYRNWDKQKPEKREALLRRAENLLTNLEVI
jgi:deoxyribodipyrimidine photolyase-related protein